jgi:hypothetical protein
MAGTTPVNHSDIKSTDAFLNKCETLDYPDRVKYVVEVGRQSRLRENSAGLISNLLHGDIGRQSRLPEKSASLISSLLEGDLYKRTLAVYTAFGSQDASLLLQRLGDPSQRLRSLAAKAFANIASDEDILKVVDTALPDVLKLLIKHLFKRHRVKLLDKVLEILKTNQSKIFDSHFAFGSKELVEDHLKTLPHPSSIGL